MLVRSASHPKKAEPSPPRPNISPKNIPAISPTLSGIRSVAYTTIDEKAEAMTSPDMNAIKTVQPRLSINGNAMAKGAAPKMEIHITYFLPNLSPNIPPATVPKAKAKRKAKRHSCDAPMPIWNLSIRKKVK